jgi:hypothetical protein
MGLAQIRPSTLKPHPRKALCGGLHVSEGRICKAKETSGSRANNNDWQIADKASAKIGSLDSPSNKEARLQLRNAGKFYRSLRARRHNQDPGFGRQFRVFIGRNQLLHSIYDPEYKLDPLDSQPA